MLQSGSIWKITGWTGKTQQVFVDGASAPLTQVGNTGGLYDPSRVEVGSNSTSSMSAGTFYCNATNHVHYAWLADGGNPNSHPSRPVSATTPSPTRAAPNTT